MQPKKIRHSDSNATELLSICSHSATISVCMSKPAVPLWSILLVTSAAVRLLMLFFGEWQDANLEVKYTDVDYWVFSDAADLVLRGR